MARRGSPTLDDWAQGKATLREYFARSPIYDDDGGGLTAEQCRTALLEALARVATLAEACRAVGVSKVTVWAWRRADAAFDAAVRERLAVAHDDYREALEQATWRRALHEMSPAYRGVPVTGIFVLKRLDHRYRDNHVEPVQQPPQRTIRFLTAEESQAAIQAQYRLLEESTGDETD